MMIPALAQICSLESSFAVDVEEYAAGQCTAIDGWLTKLERHVSEHSPSDTRSLLDAHGVDLPVASFQGGLLDSQAEARQQAWELFDRRLDLCRELNVGTIVLACDVRAPLTQPDVERVQQSLVKVAQSAGKHELRVALEFQSQAALGNNLQTAAALVEEVGSPHLGLCFDVFHYYVGPSQAEDLRYLTQENLFHVQVCDLADVPREFATDSDRILPGDGDIPLLPVISRLREINYQGLVALELMNPQLWQVPPRQMGEIGMTALRKLLDQASMG